MSQIMVRTNDILSQEIGDEILLYNLIEDRAFHLNKSLAAVYKCCHEQSDIERIRKDVSVILKESVTKDFIHLSLQELDENQLLDHFNSKSFALPTVSRRTLIKRVGYASLVALPIISSLIAPSSINAASGSGLAGQKCCDVYCSFATCPAAWYGPAGFALVAAPGSCDPSHPVPCCPVLIPSDYGSCP